MDQIREDGERLVLHREPASIAVARRFVSGVVTDPEMREVAVLLVSELTTNAVRHAMGDSFEVRVRLDGVVRVEVTDESGVLPERIPPSEEGAGGRDYSS
jgi:signal transduction histidine kinase